MKYSLLNICFLILSINAFAQKTDSVVYNPKDFIKIENNKYKVWNNWVSGGAGALHNFTYGRQNFALSLSFNYHIKQHYFRTGALLSGDAFGSYNNYQLHFCFGKRKETKKYNLAYFAGPSFSYGYKKIAGSYSSKNMYYQPGLFGVVQFIYKLKYDIGIGPSLFVDANPHQTLGGFTIDLYFSGAFDGYVKKPVGKN